MVALPINLTAPSKRKVYNSKYKQQKRMIKKGWNIIILLSTIALLYSFTVLAQDNLYQYDFLVMNLEIRGSFDLVAQSQNSIVKSTQADLLLYPREDFRQKLLDIKTQGEISPQKIIFRWTDGRIEEKEYGYKAKIRTHNLRQRVTTKVPFPLENINGNEQYTLPTESIDSDNPAIISKAAELSEGEDDLFKVVFNLASWVEDNVKYDLNTLTASASQKASWVLENREGVCDEMTSLFVAMARSLGIPARFVSGISYTTSELFDHPWQPHGWAEVYFPKIGWVSFDITFGEYGYIDVTHIKLREGFDPLDPATKFEWVAKDVNLKAEELKLDVEIKERGTSVPEEIILEQELLSAEIEPGSYNLVKAILKNEADHYAATTLHLAVPEEISIEDSSKRKIVLGPREVRETYWIIRASENLEDSFVYSMPVIIFTEKNTSVGDLFTVKNGARNFGRNDVQKLIVDDEEKTYSRKVYLECDDLGQINVDEKVAVSCTIKNLGNINLKEVRFCIEQECKTVDLPVGGKQTIGIRDLQKKIGWNTLYATADNELIEKKKAFHYVVLDPAVLRTGVEYPKEVRYGEDFSISIILDKESFVSPKEINVILEGPGFQQKWTIDRIDENQNLSVSFHEFNLANKNKFEVETFWKDDQGEIKTEKQEIIIKGKSDKFYEKIKMIMNRIVNMLI